MLQLRVKPIFEWRDLWVGVYIDTKKKAIYILPLPTLGVKISWGGAPCSSSG